MSFYFFASPMKQERLFVFAQRWIGTPFCKGGRVAGAGVDCVHLAAEIYRECGVFSDYKFPHYTLDGGKHSAKSLVLRWLDQSGCFQRNDTKLILPGDLLCFRLGNQVEHHVGVMIDPQHFIHVREHRRVKTAVISDPTYRTLVTHVFRPIEKEAH